MKESFTHYREIAEGEPIVVSNYELTLYDKLVIDATAADLLRRHYEAAWNEFCRASLKTGRLLRYCQADLKAEMERGNQCQ